MFRAILILIFGIGILLFWHQPAGAVDISTLRAQIESKNQEIKKIQEEIRSYNEEISKTSKKSNTLKNRIGELNKSVANLKKQIYLTETKISQKKLEIEELDILIIARETAINEKKEIMAEILRIFSERENRGLMGFLLQGDGLSDVFGYFEQNKNYQERLQGTIADFKNLKQELEEDKSEVVTRQNELKKIQITLADKKYISEYQRKEQQTLLTKTKNQEKRYQELLAETEKHFEEIQREIDELEEELRKQVDPNSLPPRREGFFAWPVEGAITQGYGKTPFAYNSRFYTFHNGLDIRAAVGTEVSAAEKGKVIAVGNSDSYCPRGAYGRYIVIGHGNNLMTMYAHFSMTKVSEGQTVERGEIIGYAGNSGLSTGPHLHFTVYDARTFTLRQSKLCGILPYGGSVNPNGYL